VTAADVLRVAQERLHPDKLVILAVGREQDFDQPLSTLGTVHTIDISIPPPTPKQAPLPAASPESEARGREVLEAAIRAMGGVEKLSSVRDLTLLSRILQVTPQGDLELTSKLYLVLPDKFRQDVITPFGELSLASSGGTAWQKGPQGIQEAPRPLLESMRRSLARVLVRLLPEAREGKRTVQYLESTTLGDRAVEVVLVTDGNGDAVKLFVDPSTGRVLKQAFQGMAPGRGPVEEEHLYSDFRPVQGLTVPFKVVVLQDGEKSQERTVDSVELNVGLDPALFDRPQGP
jgi:hypothetical protein